MQQHVRSITACALPRKLDFWKKKKPQLKNQCLAARTRVFDFPNHARIKRAKNMRPRARRCFFPSAPAPMQICSCISLSLLPVALFRVHLSCSLFILARLRCVLLCVSVHRNVRAAAREYICFITALYIRGCNRGATWSAPRAQQGRYLTCSASVVNANLWFSTEHQLRLDR